MLRVERVLGPGFEADAAARFLGTREVAHAMLLSVLDRVVRATDDLGKASTLWSIRDAHEIVGVVVFHRAVGRVLWSEIDEAVCHVAADTVMHALRHDHAPVTSTYGPEPIARVFAERWSRENACRVTVRMRYRHFEIDRVEHPARVAGRMRVANERDIELLARFADAFVTETGLPEEDRIFAQPDRIRARVAAGEFFVWAVDDDIASIASVGGTARVRRIGSVYTPPAARSRGYASALVATLTQRLLDEGAWRVSLTTDPSSPIPNRIYPAIGYRAVSEGVWYGFDALA
jgi:predicted GNAT family acetyltransferase